MLNKNIIPIVFAWFDTIFSLRSKITHHERHITKARSSRVPSIARCIEGCKQNGAKIIRLIPIVFIAALLCFNLSAGQANAMQPNTAQEQPTDFDSLFEKANNFYKEGSYETAMELYNKISDKNAAINYNLGNCAYKLNKLGLAHLYWRRAEKDWGIFGRTELLSNIRLLQDKIRERKHGNTEKKTEEILKNLKSLKLRISSFIRATPPLYFQLVFLFFWLFLFISIRNLMRRKKKVLIATLFTFIAISGLLLVSKYNFEYKQFGIVVTGDAKLLSGPGNNYQVLSFVPEAKEVIIQKNSNGFYKIKFSSQIGWISQASVEKI